MGQEYWEQRKDVGKIEWEAGFHSRGKLWSTKREVEVGNRRISGVENRRHKRGDKQQSGMGRGKRERLAKEKEL